MYVSVESQYCNKLKVARLVPALGTKFSQEAEINNQPSNQKQRGHTHGVIHVSFHTASPVCRTGREGGSYLHTRNDVDSIETYNGSPFCT